jgi:DNA polymerase elongation subunit (family B)
MSIKRLFVDIDTSPNIGRFWRAGFKLNITPERILEERKIVCIGYKWAGEKEIKCPSWDKDMDDRAMLEEFIPIMNSADEIVAHNGDRFDVPWIKTRAIINGLPMFPRYKTVDTCKMARSNFYFNSNKLAYISKVLGFEGKLATNYDLWKKVCVEGDRKALAYMVKYCKKDITELEDVYNEIAPYCVHKSHAGVMAGKEKWSCANCSSERVIKSKTRVTAMGTPQHQMQCKDCGRYFTISNATFTKWQEEK